MEPDDHSRFPSSDDLRRDARHDFPFFYATASARDADLMDALVLCHAALVLGFNISRNLPAALRAGVERTTDKTEQAFMHAREQVKACPGFRALRAEEQLAVEWSLFQPKPAPDE